MPLGKKPHLLLNDELCEVVLEKRMKMWKDYDNDSDDRQWTNFDKEARLRSWLRWAKIVKYFEKIHRHFAFYWVDNLDSNFWVALVQVIVNILFHSLSTWLNVFRSSVWCVDACCTLGADGNPAVHFTW